MSTPVDIRVMVPRVRRSLEGAGTPAGLTDDAIKDVVADACADVMLYTGSLFGGQLVVTARDADSNAPTEYATEQELTLAQQSVIAAQAALNYFFFLFAGMKVSETIQDEGSQWSYDLSPSLLVEQMRMLQKARDSAIDAITEQDRAAYDTYISFLSIRDRETTRLAEPWAARLPVGGAEVDERFGGAIGGDFLRFGGPGGW